jgi:8-oxo-dGTP pyrophosphatase MutT (NUDIX family)
MLEELRYPPALKKHISGALYENSEGGRLFPPDVATSAATSSVLFLLGEQNGNGRRRGEPCIVLNKRSAKVRQPGDLCFPGGRIDPRLDIFLSRVMMWPLSPLARWPHWPRWRADHRGETESLCLLLATALRESVEEMRLNPFGLTFLGPMPSQDLSLFRRVLYPMVVWINRQKHFLPNWEVEKIVRISLKNLLDPSHYACYRIRFEHRQTGGVVKDFPCFLHGNEREILWGVTYRIVAAFLEYSFGFKPPALELLPVTQGHMGESYLRGAGEPGRIEEENGGDLNGLTAE